MKQRIATALLLMFAITMVLTGCNKKANIDNVADSTAVQVTSDSTVVK